MTPKQAIALVKSYAGDPNITIESCKNYGMDYLITAYKDPTEMDPFYLVNKFNSSVRKYTIAENPARYYNTPEVQIR
jgi:hypothetical protein